MPETRKSQRGDPMADETRLTRRCDGCGQIDDHPHHVVSHAAGGGTSMHHDCCASRGCDVCSEVLAAHDNKTGHDLLASIRGGENT